MLVLRQVVSQTPKMRQLLHKPLRGEKYHARLDVRVLCLPLCAGGNELFKEENVSVSTAWQCKSDFTLGYSSSTHVSSCVFLLKTKGNYYEQLSSEVCGRSGIPLLLSLKFTMLSSFMVLFIFFFCMCCVCLMLVSQISRKLHGERTCLLCSVLYITNPYHIFWHTARTDK